MYYVTYKNVLRSDKKRKDFVRWLKIYWPIQQQWGATSFKLWNGTGEDTGVLFCRYTVENLERWNRGALSPKAEKLIRELSDIVDIDRMSIKITVTSSPDYNN